MSLRKYLMRVQKGKCHYCKVQMSLKTKGRFFATEDHIIPRSRGGGNSYLNLVGACFTCNNMRGDLPYQVFKSFIELHGNGQSITAVLRSLSHEDYQRHKHIYDVITHGRTHSATTPLERPPIAVLEPHVESVKPTFRRPFLHLTRRKIESIIIGIPYRKRMEFLAGQEEIKIKESEECQTPSIPSQQFLTTPMFGSLPQQKKTAKALWT